MPKQRIVLVGLFVGTLFLTAIFMTYGMALRGVM